jgi:hypothetical protein
VEAGGESEAREALVKRAQLTARHKQSLRRVVRLQQFEMVGISATRGESENDTFVVMATDFEGF